MFLPDIFLPRRGELRTVPPLNYETLEVEHHPSLIPKAVGSASTSNVETGVQIIDLRRSECDSAGMVDRNIKAAAESQSEGVIRRSRGIASSIVEIRGQIGVRSPD